jgi:hypothetical protein
VATENLDDMTAAAGRAQTGATRVAATSKDVDKNIRRMSSASAGGANNMRMMSMQLSQVAQQGAVTGNYMQALAFQLPDLMLGFGTLGVLIGAASAAFVPLISQLGEGDDAAQSMGDQLEQLAAAVDAYEQAAERARLSSAELAEEFGTAAREARNLLEIQRQIQLLDAMAQVSAAQRSVIGEFGDPDLLVTTREEFERLLDTLSNSTGTGRGLDRVLAQVDSIQNLRAQFDMTTSEALEFNKALRELDNAEGLRAQAEALVRVNDLLVESLGSTENWTEQQKEVVRQTAMAAEEAFRVANMSDQAASAISGAASAATGLANEMNRAAVNAAETASQMLQSQLARTTEAEIQLRYRDDPVARAGELAGFRFDQRTDDISGADPIVQEAVAEDIARRREQVVAAAEAQARYAEQLRETGRASGGAAAQVEQMTAAQRQAEQVINRARQAAVEYGDVLAVLDERLAAGEISQGTYNAAIQQLEDQMGGLTEATQRGAEAMTDLFGAIFDDSRDAKDALADLLQQMAQVQFQKAIMGLADGGVGGGFFSWLGEALSFDGGGYTGSGSRTGGVDGRGGFPAILHPQETVIDHTKGQTARGGRVEVVARVEQDGSIVQTIERVSGDVSARVMEAGLENYDRHVLPDRVQNIGNDPARRG